MTRGRPPKKAVAEAFERATCRGGVMEIPDTSGLPFDLLIFSPACIAFVMVMRMRGRVTDPPDALVYQSGSVIRKLRIVPESAVAVMELLCTSYSIPQKPGLRKSWKCKLNHPFYKFDVIQHSIHGGLP